mmetsp:Transcript_22679/g.73390  ORF Transcript_22679/g.73390 Transcript_22679/m.73390 type:complete len:248 (-) Transcript_22679:506-1249(-)
MRVPAKSVPGGEKGFTGVARAASNASWPAEPPCAVMALSVTAVPVTAAMPMSLYGMRSTQTLKPASTIGASKRANASASLGESLTCCISVTATMSVHACRRPSDLRRCRPWRKASRSSTMECVVVGTSCRRLASSAAWTDQASMPGRPAAATMAAGDGPTVETDTLVRASWKHSWSVRRRTARRTAAGLLSGSPMPMKTTLCSLGMPRSAITRWARATCATISSAERLRMRPILPVAQKTQPREQPT